MNKPKSNKALTQLFQATIKLYKSMTLKDIQWLLRGWLVSSRQQTQAGFVLPTVVLVLLVVGLTVAALLFRSLSRTNQVIGQREQQEIYNAATPAIDRAKSKLEYLFKNGKLPSGIPSESKLAELMNNDDYNFFATPIPASPPKPAIDRNEYRLDLDGNTATKENAWAYRDAKGNTIAYSILMKTEAGAVNVNTPNAVTKANNLVVRSGPVNTVGTNAACTNATGTADLDQGWFRDSASTGFLRKNFQVNAVVIGGPDLNGEGQTVTTLEFQQERQVDRGNKWGAWFINDLEIFPGPAFNWNGALHTEGSIFLGQSTSSTFKAHLISSPASCLWGVDGREASEISMKDQPQEVDPNNPTIVKTLRFQGQIVSGSMKDNLFAANGGRIDRTPSDTSILGSGSDSVAENSVAPARTPADVALDPLTLLTEGKSIARRATDPHNTTGRDSAWDSSNPLAQGATKRVYNKQVTKPYVDDSYRADDRYGPKLPTDGLLPGTKVGDPIPPSRTELISSNPIAGNAENVGLDGYWERRTRNQGLRIIVGQRLELGNPLDVPTALGARPHEALQRRTQRDNLAAVQATAIYFHEDSNGDVPLCLATTVHPGTAATLRRSSTFEKLSYRDLANRPQTTVFNDFFTGNGTNGWEYRFTGGTPNAAQLQALNNLANFAGDPTGAFPATQDISTSGLVHPYPPMVRHGDFSNLRRALIAINNGTPFANLSIADRSYIDTASCALGMVAEQIRTLQNYSYPNNIGADAFQQLDELNTALTPAAIVPGNPQRAIADLTAVNPKLGQLARLVYLKEQVEWDRLAPGAANPGCTFVAPIASLVKLCPTAQTQNSALFYIFPLINHGEAAIPPLPSPPRSNDAYITRNTVNPLTNTNLYQGIDDLTELGQISLTPRSDPTFATGGSLLDNTNVSGLTDPINGGTYRANTNVPNHRRFGLIRYVDTYNPTPVNDVYRIPFKDSALFNGREMMNVRVLNIDLDLLRTQKPNATDTWLPTSGLIYAFREDAVREDGIARPALGSWNAYKDVWGANIASGPPNTNAGTPSQIWRMNAVNPQDPPVNGLIDTAIPGSPNVAAIAPGGTGISPKPIDYYPDPARRPYGFRLRQGISLLRTGADNTSGLTFISDNPAYIQGDFNHHRNSSGNPLEEFTQALAYGSDGYYNNFYTRSTKSTEFAKPADSWRPTEVLADAITILSDNFCDGSVEDGLFISTATGAPSGTTQVAQNQYGCGTANIETSYLNQNRPSSSITYANWLREIPSDLSSPIAINNNGFPLTGTTFPGTQYPGNYQNFSDTKQRNPATDSRVNAILVSGLVPSRAQQAYGGLHNFPRFLENWNSLLISGSFIQLNFSTYATAPFDQDAWERTDNSVAAEQIPYYSPPARRWGYDVALQFQPPGAVSRRFTGLNPTRSEYYRELPIEDPYIKKLRCATREGASNKIDPKATCP